LQAIRKLKVLVIGETIVDEYQFCSVLGKSGKEPVLEGSIVNPRFPAAVGARSITCQKIAGAIFGAFRGLLPPEEVMASSNDEQT